MNTWSPTSTPRYAFMGGTTFWRRRVWRSHCSVFSPEYSCTFSLSCRATNIVLALWNRMKGRLVKRTDVIFTCAAGEPAQNNPCVPLPREVWRPMIIWGVHEVRWFFAWRQKQNWLPNRRASLENYTIFKVKKKKDFVSGLFIWHLCKPHRSRSDWIQLWDFVRKKTNVFSFN